MKEKIKIRKIILTAMLIVSFVFGMALTRSNAATDNVKIIINPVPGAGDDYTIQVSFADIPARGIDAVNFSLTFDKNVEILSVTKGVIADTGAEALEKDLGGCFDYYIQNGQINFIWTTGSGENYAIKNPGVFATISCKSSESINIKSIKIGYLDAANKGIPYAYTIENRTMSITYLCGDVNCDGDINTADIILLAKKLTGRIELTSAQTLNAKTTSSEAVNADCLLALIKYMTGEVISLPV